MVAQCLWVTSKVYDRKAEGIQSFCRKKNLSTENDERIAECHDRLRPDDRKVSLLL